ncbi:tyrosine-type recombinase/integrase [Parageobacillus toebii NBRC 107807]|uniref:Integrase/recombinase XerD n=1 Tax=Parageobacillus toebii NBRC 107807 TaxID=1223503 RepID=A0A6G9J001_9BACL|nr:tyrosine-type recombinase/integrase [Parageobacillus toebii]MBB3868684.1 integrase/recombinase XerD [Parageobacillus toebii NBRC 107807]QIQ32038.1 tyrosine-type recombinase/integrase [Parageobacillus toebii NBRC 107807]
MIVTTNYDLPIYTSKFLRYLKRQHYSEETITGYEKDLKKFNEFLYREYHGNILTEEIQKEDILDYLGYLESLGLKPNSVARHLSTLKSFYKFLVHEMDFKVDVAARIKHPRIYTPLPEILDMEEVQQFLNTAKRYSEFYYVLFSLIYYTGSRLTPIRTLPKKHVDLKHRCIYFEKIKGGRDLHLPLNDHMYHILANFLINQRYDGSEYVFNSPKFKNKPIDSGAIRLTMRKIAKLAGINKRVTPHILRHCTATHLTLLNVDQKYIASILGHVDLRSTARYQQLNVENLRPAVNKLK